MQDEQGLWAVAMRLLGDGDPSGLITLLRRGDPISAEVADFVGALISGREINGHAFSFNKIAVRGQPKNREDVVRRQIKAVYFAWYLMREGQNKTSAINEARDKFGVSRDAILSRFDALAFADLSKSEGYDEAVREGLASSD